MTRYHKRFTSQVTMIHQINIVNVTFIFSKWMTSIKIPLSSNMCYHTRTSAPFFEWV